MATGNTGKSDLDEITFYIEKEEKDLSTGQLIEYYGVLLYFVLGGYHPDICNLLGNGFSKLAFNSQGIDNHVPRRDENLITYPTRQNLETSLMHVIDAEFSVCESNYNEIRFDYCRRTLDMLSILQNYPAILLYLTKQEKSNKDYILNIHELVTSLIITDQPKVTMLFTLTAARMEKLTSNKFNDIRESIWQHAITAFRNAR